MSEHLCVFKKEAISYTTNLVDASSFGQVDGNIPLYQGMQTHFQSGVNFTHYYQDLMKNYAEEANKDCFNSKICLGLTTSFFWTGKSRFSWTFGCQHGKICKYLIEKDSESWTSLQYDISASALPVYTDQAYNVQYLRHFDPSKLTLSFMTYGSSTVKVFFNEVLGLSKMHMLHKQSDGYMPVTVQGICRFDYSGISEGIFAIEINNSSEKITEGQ